MKSRVTVLAAFAAGCAVASIASANNGVLLPLDQYQAGTESTNNTIVQNGGFESVTAGVTDNWAVTGTVNFAAPAGPNNSPVNGARAAQYTGNATSEPNMLTQSVNVSANTDYVLSGYLWNYSNNGEDLVLLEAIGEGNTFINNVSMLPNFGGLNAANGVFGYITFNSGANTSISLEAEFDMLDPIGGRPALSAQIDNISLTPASEFAAPRAIPEPASLSMLAGLAVALRRARR